MRLFFALHLPDAIRGQLAALRTDVGRASWVKPEQLHLTLRFVGEVDEPTAARLAEAARAELEGAGWPAPTLRLRGVGTFGRPRRPRVLWAGLEPLEPLARLAESLETATRRVELPAEERPFAAHVTLARLKHPRLDAIEAFLNEHAALESEPFTVGEVTLFCSALTSRGSIHEPVERFPLGP